MAFTTTIERKSPSPLGLCVPQRLSIEQRYLWEHATLLFRNHEWREAVTLFELLAQVLTYANKAKCLINAGQIHRCLGDFDQAATSFALASKQSHHQTLAYFLLGLVECERSNDLAGQACFELAYNELNISHNAGLDLNPDFSITKAILLHNISTITSGSKVAHLGSGVSPPLIFVSADSVFEAPEQSAQLRKEAVNLITTRTQHREVRRHESISDDLMPLALTFAKKEVSGDYHLHELKRLSASNGRQQEDRRGGVLNWIAAVGRSSASSSASSRISSLLIYYREEQSASRNAAKEEGQRSTASSVSKASEQYSTSPSSTYDLPPIADSPREEKSTKLDDSTSESLWPDASMISDDFCEPLEFILRADKLRLVGQDAVHSASNKYQREASPTRFLTCVERGNRLRMERQDWHPPAKNDPVQRRPPSLRRTGNPFVDFQWAVQTPDPRLVDDGMSTTMSIVQRDRAETLASLEGRTVPVRHTPSNKLRRFCLYKGLPPLPYDCPTQAEPAVQHCSVARSDSGTKAKPKLLWGMKSSSPSVTTSSGVFDQKQWLSKKISRRFGRA